MINAEDFLIRWNYQFPLDRWYRKKYGIKLFSPEHLALSQIDIALEFVEEQMFSKYLEQIERDQEAEKDYKKGIWLRKPYLSEEEEDRLFDNFNPSDANMSNKVDG